MSGGIADTLAAHREALCEVMHDAYEAAAAEQGWETQERSRKPWAEVPEANKATMRVAVDAMLAHLSSAGYGDLSALLDDLRGLIEDAGANIDPMDPAGDWNRLMDMLDALFARYAPSDPTPKEQQR